MSGSDYIALGALVLLVCMMTEHTIHITRNEIRRRRSR
jgi:hypothetical protein